MSKTNVSTILQDYLMKCSCFSLSGLTTGKTLSNQEPTRYNLLPESNTCRYRPGTLSTRESVHRQNWKNEKEKKHLILKPISCFAENLKRKRLIQRKQCTSNVSIHTQQTPSMSCRCRRLDSDGCDTNNVILAATRN